MKVIFQNETYIPIYHAKYELFDLEYDGILNIYSKSFKAISNDFQSLFECITIQLYFWLNDFEEDRDPIMMEKLLFEINGCDFYKFFYDYESGFPNLIIDEYDGLYLYDNEIIDVKFNLRHEAITFNLDEEIQLEVSRNEFPIIFNCDSSDTNKTIFELINEKKLYFDGGHYFFINEKNYKRLMLYMFEQVKYLNKIYH